MICTRCVMDDSLSGIKFDANGECNFCKIHDVSVISSPIGDKGKVLLDKIIIKIKNKGNGKKYDCIIGVSGGTDSSYVLYLAKSWGLRPLAVHLDNNWNTDFSMKNIETLVNILNVDLKIIKVDWDEFKDLQLAFLKASVPDAEIPTDTGIVASLYNTAKEKNVKYVIDGQAFRIAGKAPIPWSWEDGTYIKSVNKKFGKRKLVNYPNLTIYQRLWYTYIDGIKFVSPLNYVDYNVNEVKTFLQNEFGWIPYEGKHYESVYTRFIQTYLLPKKFNIDKRKTHFSALIRSGQMSRDKALNILQTDPPYPEELMEQDIKNVMKKLDLTENDFEEIMKTKPKSFLDYPNNYAVWRFFAFWGVRLGQLPKKFDYYIWDYDKY